MRTLTVFESLTLNGFFAGPNGDLDWAYARNNDPEFDAFVQDNASSAGTLLFGRTTYEMMSSWWPSEMAAAQNPEVAAGMNAAEKIVFSSTLKKAEWTGTLLVKDDPAEYVRNLKKTKGKNLVVLGSGKLVAGLAEAGLIDTCQFVYKPVVLGAGCTLFAGVKTPLGFRIASTRAFRDGNLVVNLEREN